MVEGLGGPEGHTRSVNAYDASSGAKLWSSLSKRSIESGSGIRFDPKGKILCLSDDDHGHSILLEMPTRAVLGELDKTPECLSPGARRWLGTEAAEPADRCFLYSIYEQGHKRPVVQIAINSGTPGILTQFSPDGRQVIWGDAEGSVSICDLDEVQRRLAEVDLGW